MPAKKLTIGVIGGKETSAENYQIAYELGQHIAGNNAILVCGGMTGIMEAVSKGAFENNGIVVGILPGNKKEDANNFTTITIPTGMGIARNALIIRASDVIIAFPGSYGTLSEIALALAMEKTVIYLPGSWDLKKIATIDSSLLKEAFDARQAIGLALNTFI